MGYRSKYHKCGLVLGEQGREVVVAGIATPNTYGSLIPSEIIEVYNLASGVWRSETPINFWPVYSSKLSFGNSFALVGGWNMGEGVNAWTFDESSGVWYGLTDRIEGTSTRTGLSAVIPVDESMFDSCTHTTLPPSTDTTANETAQNEHKYKW